MDKKKVKSKIVGFLVAVLVFGMYAIYVAVLVIGWKLVKRLAKSILDWYRK